MNIEEKNMLDFLSAVQMGEKIFELYYEKTANKNLKKLIKDTLSLFKSHEEKLKNIISAQGYNYCSCLKASQKMAIYMEKIKIHGKNDFYLCLTIISSIKTAINKALVFIFRNHEKFSQSYLDACKEIIRDYDDVMLKYKDFATNLI